MRTTRGATTITALALAAVIVLGACGSDNKATTKAGPAKATTTTEEPTTTTTDAITADDCVSHQVVDGKCAPATTEAPTTTTSKPDVTPSPADYLVGMKVTSKQCYEVRCNLTMKPDLHLVNDTGKSDINVDITFEVTGDRNGTIIQTTTLQPDGTYDTNEISIETTNAGVIPSAKITSVEEAAG